MSKSAPYGSLTRGAIQRLPRRLPRRPVRQARGGGFVGSVTFPSTRLVVRVLIALGADLAASPLTWAWEDITAYVRYDPAINIEVGRPDEQSTVVPGRMALRLDNRDARFTRRNATSPYYGLLSMNTPIWVTVDPGSGVVTRAEMLVNEWPNRWPDKSANDCVVTVQCAGIMRRLQQGEVLNSALRRAVTFSGPVAYFPLEDGFSATSAASGLTDGATGTVYSGLSFASAPTLAGAVAAVSAETPAPANASEATSGNLRLPFATHTVATTETLTFWTQGTPFASPPTGGVQVTVAHRLRFAAGGGIGYADIMVTSFDASTFAGSVIGYWIQFFDTAGLFIDELYTGTDHPTWDPFDGDWHEVQLVLTQSGADIAASVYADGVVGDTVTLTSRTLTAMSYLVVGSTGYYQDSSNFYVTPYSAPYSIGHVSVHRSQPDSMYQAGLGYAGEMAHVRAARLCAEASVPFKGLASVSAAMGPQPAASLLNLLRECETADQGVLYETGWGIGYQAVSERYNAPVALALDFASGHIAEIPEPADDDQRVRNRWTVSRPDGSEATVEQTSGPMGTGADGPGIYDDSKTVNVETDEQLPHHASWRVHLGTVDEDRWPRLDINLTRNPSLIPSWLALPWGARTTAANPPASMAPDPIDAVIEGYSEHIDPILWTANLATAPSSPYVVFTVDQSSSNLGRIDSGDSFLLTDEDSTTTSLAVDGTLPWSTNTAGLDLGIGGERVTVGSVASYAADTFTRVTANGWGTADSGGGWLTNGGAASEYSTSGTTGVHAPTAASSTRITHQQLGILDSRSLLDVRAPAIATGAEIRMGRLCRYTSASFFYHVLICWQTDSTVDLTINSRVNGTDTELVRVEGLGTYASGDWWRLLVDVRGTTVRAMAWNTSAVAPILWQASVTNTSLYTAGSVGVRTFLAAGNTNTLPLTCEYDNNDVQLPQLFTVTRSVNTVVKSQTANTKVSLWRPAVVGL